MRIRETMLASAFGFLALCGVGVTLVILAGVVAFFAVDHPWALGAVVVSGAAALALYARRRRHSRDVALPMPHPGPRLHAIRPSGPIGLVFVAGYLFMFLGEFPVLIPVAMGIVVAGALGAALLVARRQRRSPAASSVLSLRNGAPPPNADSREK